MRGSMAADCDGEAAGGPASAEKPVHKPLVPVICVVSGLVSAWCCARGPASAPCAVVRAAIGGAVAFRPAKPVRRGLKLHHIVNWERDAGLLRPNCRIGADS